MLIVLFLPAGLLPTVQRLWGRRHTGETEYTNQVGALRTRRDREFRRRASPRASSRHGRTRQAAARGEGRAKAFGGLLAVDGADLRSGEGASPR